MPTTWPAGTSDVVQLFGAAWFWPLPPEMRLGASCNCRCADIKESDRGERDNRSETDPSGIAGSLESGPRCLKQLTMLRPAALARHLRPA
jgi:hypothetical protein